MTGDALLQHPIAARYRLNRVKVAVVAELGLMELDRMMDHVAAQHGLSIVPIWVGGTHEAMPPGQNWPKRVRGRFFSRRVKVEVRFGPPILPRDPADRREVMAEVREFWEREGLPENGGQPLSVHEILSMRAHERRLAEHGEPANGDAASNV